MWHIKAQQKIVWGWDRMMTKRVLAAAFGGALFAVAGIAAAGNFASDRQGDFFAAGTHQFYVWCNGAHDYVATEKGANAEEAQMKLYNAAKAAGRSSCWPVWQGRVAGG
jgi:hypothetical protein